MNRPDHFELPAVPFAQHPEFERALRRLMEWTIPALLKRSSEVLPQALFLSGTAAWGEMSGVPCSNGLWLPLSDIDLSLVVKHRTPELKGILEHDLQQNFRERGRATGLSASPVTIGTYDIKKLRLQAPTLGVAEMRRAGCCLWGDAKLLYRFPDPERDGLRRWEIIRLLFNRSMELVEACAAADKAAATGDEEAAWKRGYLTAKMSSDLGTILLAMEGRLLWGMANRLSVLDDWVSEGLLPKALGDFLKESVRCRQDPTSLQPERKTSWDRLEPLADMLGWLHWTWDRILDKYNLTERPFPHTVLRWEEGGLRDRFRQLRQILTTPQERGKLRSLANWWGMRPAACFRSSLGSTCLMYLLLLDPGREQWSLSAREHLGGLSPWVDGRSREAPRSALQELGRWIVWMRGIEG
ncbi:MAG: hypothetical protein KJ970_06845 [Candidatus Eisenbacteria bacterium]|uniref:Uncharacterized protein n=1 Tax=Eiseniibacteriota bacterium TaxID=2212470 RepID=A0A948RVA8_UNCEI|nr:hypothetical protein [Candidatus Eisenbacteria bacterium]MBU1949836.1 hypothetical protein [Candidatus Eisenbacteria bacterium]MBU2690631.1 hypothetical protein [Candidatus Eisenbacteria bacterium]